MLFMGHGFTSGGARFLDPACGRGNKPGNDTNQKVRCTATS